MALPSHHHPIQRIFVWIFFRVAPQPWLCPAITTLSKEYLFEHYSERCHNHGSVQPSPPYPKNISLNILLSSITTIALPSHHHPIQQIFVWIFFWAVPQPWLCVVITTLSNKYFFEYFSEKCHKHGFARPSPSHPKNIFLNITIPYNKYFLEYFSEQCHNHASVQPSQPFAAFAALQIFVAEILKS